MQRPSYPPDLRVELFNFGLKGLGNQPLPKADLYLDCRGLPDASAESSFSGKTGDHTAVQVWVNSQAPKLVQAYRDAVLESLANIPHRRRAEEKPYGRPFRVACFCAFGIHRSRAMKHLLHSTLLAHGIKAHVVPAGEGAFGAPGKILPFTPRPVGNHPRLVVVN
jgi:RNase adaptor protein for sRNA GlmZ degradation